MDSADFIQLATRGDERQAVAELRRDPALASARDPQGVSVVCWAVYARRAELAAALAAARADLDVFEASCLGDLDTVVQLVKADPGRVNAPSPDGFSATGFSAFFGHTALLRKLIALGGDVNIPSQNAMRVCPLHSAAAHSDQGKAVALAAIVLEAGAKPNAQQQRGFTALHEAALKGNSALIELLLRHGADPGLANEEGTYPADLARSNGHSEAVRLLERRSA